MKQQKGPTPSAAPVGGRLYFPIVVYLVIYDSGLESLEHLLLSRDLSQSLSHRCFEVRFLGLRFRGQDIGGRPSMREDILEVLKVEHNLM